MKFENKNKSYSSKGKFSDSNNKSKSGKPRFRYSNKASKLTNNSGYSLDEVSFEHGTPTPETVSPQSVDLQHKAFRDLQNTGAIEVKMSPYNTAFKGDYPYVIIDKTLPVQDANYAGNVNIVGNSVVQLQNSLTSSFIKIFDTVRIEKQLNYLYVTSNTADLNYDHDDQHHEYEQTESKDDNLAVWAEFVKTSTDALSTGASTMTTQLPFFTNDTFTEYPYIESSDYKFKELTGLIFHYQTVIQNLLGVPAKYKQLMSLEQTLKNMSFRREAPILTELYGLFKKASFKSAINTIGTTILNEYVDRNWYDQTAVLVNNPSRRTNGMVDPLITMVATTKVPRAKFRLPTGGDFIYDSDRDLTESTQLVDVNTWEVLPSADHTLEDITKNILQLMDQSVVLTWSRMYLDNNIHADYTDEQGVRHEYLNSFREYSNTIINLTNLLAKMAGRFSTFMEPVRTFLDKIKSADQVYWQKNQVFYIDSINDCPPSYNVLLADVVNATGSGSNSISFDNITQRWRTYTMWNRYIGYASYDEKSGGSFLTFSLRYKNPKDTSGTTISRSSSAYLLPELFQNISLDDASVQSYSTKIWASSRDGLSVEINAINYNASALSTDPILARFNPLNQQDLNVRVPGATIPDKLGIKVLTVTEKNIYSSNMLLLLTTIFSYGAVRDGSNFYSSADPDNIAFIDFQIDDVSNSMITYARNYNPFKVATPDPNRTIGFVNK